jgi:hypothetical protein
MDSRYGAEPGHYPDGLTEQNIDALLRELDTAITKPRPTSALIDETDAQRRHRRQARRHAAAVARAWPSHAATDDPGGWAA